MAELPSDIMGKVIVICGKNKRTLLLDMFKKYSGQYDEICILSNEIKKDLREYNNSYHTDSTSKINNLFTSDDTKRLIICSDAIIGNPNHNKNTTIIIISNNYKHTKKYLASDHIVSSL